MGAIAQRGLAGGNHHGTRQDAIEHLHTCAALATQRHVRTHCLAVVDDINHAVVTATLQRRLGQQDGVGDAVERDVESAEQSGT